MCANRESAHSIKCGAAGVVRPALPGGTGWKQSFAACHPAWEPVACGFWSVLFHLGSLSRRAECGPTSRSPRGAETFVKSSLFLIPASHAGALLVRDELCWAMVSSCCSPRCQPSQLEHVMGTGSSPCASAPTCRYFSNPSGSTRLCSQLSGSSR